MTSWLKSGVAGGVDFAYFAHLTGDVLSIRVGWGGGMITFFESFPHGPQKHQEDHSRCADFGPCIAGYGI